MQAYGVNFMREILSNGRYYYIPVYQRNYSWQEEQCKQLYSDIMKLYSDEYSEHFIGTIVWKPDNSNTENLSVIDGQQRLTTMFLFVLAMLHISDDENFKRELSSIIINPYREKVRLVPIKADNEVFTLVVQNEIEDIKDLDNRIYCNYSYFKERLIADEVDLRKLYDKLSKLNAIKMELGYDDNPQIIFESINSTGMSLSIADLIRNYLLMNEPYDVQTELFEKYWYKFETKLGVDNLVLFFEHFLNIKTNEKTVTRSNMYKHFKVYFQSSFNNARELLEYLVDYIEVYNFLINKEIKFQLIDSKKTKKLAQYRDELIGLGNKVVNMFLMQVLIEFKSNKLTEEDLLYAFEMTLSYIMRRSVVGLATNVLQRTFRTLFKQIDSYRINYSFKAALDYSLVVSKRNANSRFPTDEEFFTSLHTRNLYGKFRYINYLLFKLENYDNKTVLADEDISIEHIMPQTITEYWKQQLGSDWKMKYEESVNDLGNLTLTSYNSNLSNFDFETKKEILNDESHIKLNNYFKTIENWDDQQIDLRGRKLANEALGIWRYPEIDNSLAKEIEDSQYNILSLEELASNYMSLRPFKVDIIDSQYKINSLKDIMIYSMKYCLEHNEEYILNKFVDNENYSRLSSGERLFIFATDSSNVKSPEQVPGFDVYCDINRSGQNCVELSNELLKYIGVDTSKVILRCY